MYKHDKISRKCEKIIKSIFQSILIERIVNTI